jgi:tRNA A37 threonylcarbamoyladenosine dehydratase
VDAGGASPTLCGVPSQLSESESERYAEQVERIGVEAQRRLKDARAIVLGARAPGSAAAAHLVSCGVGYVGVVDGGVVVRPDLCGQSLLYTPDVGANRAEAVAAKLGVLNTDTQTESYPVDIEAANAHAILLGHDVAVDCRGGASLEESCRSAGVALVTAEGGHALDGLRAAEQALVILAAAAGVPEEATA